MGQHGVRFVLGLWLLCSGVSAWAAGPSASLSLRSCSRMDAVASSRIVGESCAQGNIAPMAQELLRLAAGTRGRSVVGSVENGALFAALNERPGLKGLRLRGGAKSKNHTAHNKNSKEHRNGIKRVKTYRNETTKFRAIKMWRNTKYARKGSMRIHRHNLQVKREEAAASKAGAASEATEGASGSASAEDGADAADAADADATMEA